MKLDPFWRHWESIRHQNIFTFIENIFLIWNSSRPGSDVAQNGFEIELGGFKLLVYLDWREVYDESGEWEKLAWKLGNTGVEYVASPRRDEA